jgi:hypothetical protein
MGSRLSANAMIDSRLCNPEATLVEWLQKLSTAISSTRARKHLDAYLELLSESRILEGSR